MRQTVLPLSVELSRAIVESLVASGITQDDFLTGAIKHTDLPWQVPPLRIDAPLFKVPYHQYMDERAVYVNAESLVNLWSDALLNLRNKPGIVLTLEGVYRAVSYALPKTKALERSLYLSTPDGFPDGISDLAGAVLSLEVANLLRFNARIQDFVSDDDNYYAVLENAQEVGIKDGLPTFAADQWDMAVNGMVQEMLMTGRGRMFEGCDYDILAKVRSLVHVHEERMIEQEAVEWALQALRLLQGQPQLLKAVSTIKKRSITYLSRLAVIEQAKEVSTRFGISDRARIVTMRSLLVPEVLTPSEFSRKFYAFSATPPPLVHRRVLARLQQSIDSLLAAEKERYAVPD